MSDISRQKHLSTALRSGASSRTRSPIAASPSTKQGVWQTRLLRQTQVTPSGNHTLPSEGLSISRAEAKEYIERYFQTYPDVKRYLDEQVSFAHKNGYVTTLFGRRRPVPDINAQNFMRRSFSERVAMNSPIQGTAADIMKKAMNDVDIALKDRGLKARIVVQVHDELLVEAPVEEAEMVQELLKDKMEHAAELAVSLVADAKIGSNWEEAH